MDGRPTRFAQIDILLDKAMAYIDRAAAIARISEHAHHTAVGVQMAALKDAIGRFQTHFNYVSSQKSQHILARQQWEDSHKHCACCYAKDSEIPLVTTYILSNYRRAHADQPWNWLRMCVYCANKGRLKSANGLRYRLFLKLENDPLEYDWNAACTWYRNNCIRDADINWITKAVAVPTNLRKRSPELDARLDGNDPMPDHSAS